LRGIADLAASIAANRPSFIVEKEWRRLERRGFWERRSARREVPLPVEECRCWGHRGPQRSQGPSFARRGGPPLGEECLRGGRKPVARKSATGCEEEGVAGGEKDTVSEGGPGRQRGGRKKEGAAGVREE
jgi:hypothetical protein